MAFMNVDELLLVKPVVQISGLLKLARKSVNLSSERFLAIVDEGDVWSPSSIKCFDLQNLTQPDVPTLTYRKYKAGERVFAARRSHESALCLVHTVLNRVSIANLEEKGPDFVLSTDTVVQLAAWLDDGLIVLVKEKEIVHLNIIGVEICSMQIPGKLRNYCIVDYQLNGTSFKGWSLATAVKVEKSGTCRGSLNVFLLQNGLCTPVAGFAGAFLPGLDSKDAGSVRLMTADVSQVAKSLIIRIVLLKIAGAEVISHVASEFQIVHHRDHDLNSVDHPVTVMVDQIYEIAYVVTKFGYLHLVEYVSGCHIGCLRVSPSLILSVVTRENGGLLIVDDNGLVSTVEFNGKVLVPVLREKAGPLAAFKFAIQCGEPVDTGLFLEFFREAVQNSESHVWLNKMVHLYIDSLPPESTVEVLSACRGHSVLNTNDLLVLAGKARKRIGVEKVAAVFESDPSGTALFKFLSHIGPCNLKGNILKTYITVAVKLQKYAALNHLARSSTAGDPLSVRKWFLESGIPLKQLIPILETIYGKQGVALDLVRLYLQENSPAKIRALINGLPNKDGRLAEIIRYLLGSGMSNDSIFQCVSVADLTRCREIIIQECGRYDFSVAFLELLVARGDHSETVHTELLVSYILKDSHNKAHSFARESSFYDAEKVGHRVEQDRTNEALLLYEMWNCDADFIRVTNDKRLYNRQLCYLLKRKNVDLWDGALSSDFCMDLIEALDQHAWSRFDYNEASIFLQSLAKAELHGKCLMIIDQLLTLKFEPEQLKFFQGLSARIIIKSKPIAEAIENCLSVRKYDYSLVANALLEARFNSEAIETLVEGNCYDKAVEIFDRHSVSGEDISRLGQLFLKHGHLVGALRCYIRAKNYVDHRQIYRMAVADSTFRDWDVLLEYFLGVKQICKDPFVQSSLAFIFAKANRLDELEKYVFAALEETAQDNGGCRICEDAVKNISFVPCGHVFACSACAERLTECPICRAAIQSRFKIFTT